MFVAVATIGICTCVLCIMVYSLAPPILLSGIPATEALMKGLQDLNDLCSHVLDTFEVNY